jgi:two-component system nitrogen regulation response regulator NtrX
VSETATAAFVAADRADCGVLEELLRGAGYLPVPIDIGQAMPAVPGAASLCIVDLRHEADAMRIIREVVAAHPLATVIALGDPGRPKIAADALRAGVFDVLPRPPSVSDLSAVLANVKEQRALAAGVQSPIDRSASSEIIGISPAMAVVVELAQRAAAGRCGILICGERGTGREMLARTIHGHGRNPQGPFVAIDCASAPPEDVEIQLFGIAAPGESASSDRHLLERIGSRSLIAQANGGTLFVKNIGDLSARSQARFVRILRDREALVDDRAEPVGIQVRAIVGAEASIASAAEEGHLRLDLFERISLVRIDVPSLRQRREDIPALATHLLKNVCRVHNVPMKTLTRSAVTLLSALPWRGNVPELTGLLERLIVMIPQGLIRLEDVLAHVQLDGDASRGAGTVTLREARMAFERDYIASILRRHHGRIADAARTLGIQRTNLYRMMRRLNLMSPKSTRRE